MDKVYDESEDKFSFYNTSKFDLEKILSDLIELVVNIQFYNDGELLTGDIARAIYHIVVQKLIQFNYPKLLCA